jgi:hypothetical protein
MVLLYCSFNNAAGIRDYAASNGAKISERIWKEPVEAWPEAVFRHLFGVSDENHNVLQDFRHKGQDSNGAHPEQGTERLWLGSEAFRTPTL